MGRKLTYLALAIMGIGVLLAPILMFFRLEVLAGAVFLAGMLMLWAAASASFLGRLWRGK